MRHAPSHTWRALRGQSSCIKVLSRKEEKKKHWHQPVQQSQHAERLTVTGRISCLANSIIFIFCCIVDFHPGVLSVFLSWAVSLSARVHPCLRTCTAGQRTKEGGEIGGCHISPIFQQAKKGSRIKERFIKAITHTGTAGADRSASYP